MKKNKRPISQSLKTIIVIAVVIYALLITLLFYFSYQDTIKVEHFVIPPNTSVHLVWKNCLNGKQEVSRIPARTGDKVFISIDEKERVHTLDKYPLKRPVTSEQIKLKNPPKTPSRDILVLEKSKYKFDPSRFSFIFISPLTPKLIELRKQEKLEEIIDGASSELEKFILIMKWTRKIVPRGTPLPYPPWDALEILKRCRDEKLKVFCGQYTQIMVQSLLSLGYNARYVGLASHEVMEVWSNELGKWLLFDPLLCCYYESEKSVLNALEIHDYLRKKQLDSIKPVRCMLTISHDDPELKQYEKFNISLYTNQLLTGESGGVSMQNIPWRRVYWVDELSKEFSLDSGILKLITNRKSDLYSELYLIEPFLFKTESGIQVSLFANVPNLDTLQYSLNDSEWINCKQIFTLQLNKGAYKLSFRGKNQLNIIGQTSFIKFEIIK